SRFAVERLRLACGERVQMVVARRRPPPGRRRPGVSTVTRGNRGDDPAALARAARPRGARLARIRRPAAGAAAPRTGAGRRRPSGPGAAGLARERPLDAGAALVPPRPRVPCPRLEARSEP